LLELRYLRVTLLELLLQQREAPLSLRQSAYLGPEVVLKGFLALEPPPCDHEPVSRLRGGLSLPAANRRCIDTSGRSVSATSRRTNLTFATSRSRRRASRSG
jgi:hypothetical protein